MYGASGKKLAQTLKKPEHMGNKLKDDFYKKNVGIKELNDALQRAYKSRGYLIGLDGRPLYIRSEHKLLNTLLQNAATTVFKNWMVNCNKVLGFPGAVSKEVLQLLAMHDENQWEVIGNEERAKKWGALCEDMASRVGIQLGILVPIAAEAKLGRSWGECH